MAQWDKTGPRFKHSKLEVPGPGQYDPKAVAGWKADPKSGFMGEQRFRPLSSSGGGTGADDLHGSREATPPRTRRTSVPGAERKFSWATQRITKLTQDLERAHTRIKELEKHLSAHADKAQELQAKQLQIEELKLSLQQQDQRLHDQQQELQEVKQAAAEVQCRADARLEGINSLTLALDACQQELSAAKSRLSSQQTKLDDATLDRASIACLEEQLAKEQQAHSSMSTAFSDLQAEMHAIKAHLQVEQQEHAETSLELARLKEERDQQAVSAQQMWQRLDSMDSALAITAKQLEREQSAHTASQEKLKQVTDRSLIMAEQVAVLKDQCVVAENQLQVLQAELAQSQAGHTQASQELTAMQQQLAQTSARTADLQATLEQKQQEHFQITTRNSEAQQRICQLQQQAADLQKQLVHEQEAHAAVCAEHNNAQLQIRQLEQQATDLQNQYHTLNKALADHLREHQDNTTERQRMQSAQQQLEKDVCALSKKLAAANGAAAELQQDLKRVQDECNSQKDSRTTLQLQLTEAEEREVAAAADRDMLTTELTNTQKQLQALQSELASSTAEVAQLRRQVKAAEAQVDTLTSEKTELRRRLSEWQEEMARLDAVVEQLNTRICSQDERETTQKAALAELHQQVAELRAAKDSAAESLAQATKHDTEVAKEAAVLKQNIKASAAKLQDMKAALAAAEGSASAQAKELVELQSQARAYAEEVEQRSLSETRLKSQVDLLTSRLQEASDHKTSLQKQLSASESSKGELQEKYAAVLHGVKQLKAEAATRTAAEAAVSQVHSSPSLDAIRSSGNVSVNRAVGKIKAVAGMEEEMNEARQRAAAAEAEAADARELAGRSATLVLEMGRLKDENAVLGKRLDQMGDDLKELLGTSSSGLGHSNPRQKIQYHLKLKQELEELRHEATVLLKERFHLQQCIRYLAARSHELVADKHQGASSPKPCSIQLQPASLAGNVLYSSAMSAQNMSICGRGKLADKGTVYVNKTKESFEETIRRLRQQTMDEIGGSSTSCAATSTAEVLAEADDIGSTCTTTMSTVNKPCDTKVAHTLHVVVADDSSDAAGIVAEEQQLMQTPVAGKLQETATFLTPRSSFSADRSRNKGTAKRASFDGTLTPTATPRRGGSGSPSPRQRRSAGSAGSAGSPAAKACGAGGSLLGGNNSILSSPKHHELGAFASRPGTPGRLLAPTPARTTAAAVEDRILQKIAAVCSLGTSGRSSEPLGKE